ncbi:ester cyclase [Streptomyces sp. BHT-5-2]|uniref:ester cyclase n=1 Tax=Streptomyces sp. BHT-5-2 TaxID=2866715 RepID=UPI001C8EB4A8|nr:ester cyclase [Streptomyces sp. BHT-5-2]QZL06414.1 ester cyclase [Streptomyces sp. BHT-5-2]
MATTAKKLWDAVWTAVEAGSLDQLDELFASDAVFRTSTTEGTGSDYAKGVLTRHVAAYPDLRREVVSEVESADGSAIAVELFFAGTHSGALVHPNGQRIEPTGKKLRWRAVDKVEVRDGRIVSWSAVFDRLSLMQQLGLQP